MTPTVSCNVDVILSKKTLEPIPQGGVGDLAVNQMGTFVICVNQETKRAVLKCLYPVIHE